MEALATPVRQSKCLARWMQRFRVSRQNLQTPFHRLLSTIQWISDIIEKISPHSRWPLHSTPYMPIGGRMHRWHFGFPFPRDCKTRTCACDQESTTSLWLCWYLPDCNCLKKCRDCRVSHSVQLVVKGALLTPVLHKREGNVSYWKILIHVFLHHCSLTFTQDWYIMLLYEDDYNGRGLVWWLRSTK